MEKIAQTAGRAQLGDLTPDFARFNDDVLFGESYDLGGKTIVPFCPPAAAAGRGDFAKIRFDFVNVRGSVLMGMGK